MITGTFILGVSWVCFWLSGRALARSSGRGGGAASGSGHGGGARAGLKFVRYASLVGVVGGGFLVFSAFFLSAQVVF